MKKLIGHSVKMDTFGTYGHEVNGDLQKAANMTDARFDGLMKETDEKTKNPSI